jgi:hypothetical protein
MLSNLFARNETATTGSSRSASGGAAPATSALDAQHRLRVLATPPLHDLTRAEIVRVCRVDEPLATPVPHVVEPRGEVRAGTGHLTLAERSSGGHAGSVRASADGG